MKFVPGSILSNCLLLLSSLSLGLSAVVPHDLDAQRHLGQLYPTTSYSVARLSVNNDVDVKDILRKVQSHNLDVWSVSDSGVDIHLPEGTEIPSNIGGTFEVINHEYTMPPPSPNSTHGPWDVKSMANCTFHEAYQSYESIVEFVNQLAKEFPKIVQVLNLGQTSEGREIIGLSISRRKTNKRKRRIVIQGAQHAREWIATSTALYVAHSLVLQKADERSMRRLLKRMDFTVIPLPNPDGYVYTMENDRLWYKNRQDIEGGDCKGLDLNRNWDYEWQPAADANPCSHWYPGSHPFQGLESRAIAAYIKRTPNIRAFLDLRSYGQIIMHPFSHSCDAHPPDEENLMEAALGAAKAMFKAHGTIMRTGSLCDKLYSAPGNIVDWMYGRAQVSVSYSVMLRDTGTYGFLLPPHWIRPVGEETADMVAFLSKWIRKVGTPQTVPLRS